jgi:Glutamate-cysteine ligase
MKRTRRAKQPAQPRCVLDSGGVTALVGGSQRARAWLRWVVDHDGTITVPTPVLVECTIGDGARDAEVNRVLGILQRAAAVLEAPNELTARRAGRLRFLAGLDDGIDALVAAAAVADGTPAVVLTSDPDDLERLLLPEPQVRSRLGAVVSGREVGDVILQEGVPTYERVNDAVAEPVVYMIDRYVVGGFYRVNAERGADESLSTPGASFVPLAFAESGQMPKLGAKPGVSAPNRFYMYGVIARLAMVAASYELEATDPNPETYE